MHSPPSSSSSGGSRGAYASIPAGNMNQQKKKQQFKPSSPYQSDNLASGANSSSGSGNNGTRTILSSPNKPYKSLVTKPNVQIKGTPQILAKRPTLDNVSNNQPTISVLQKPIGTINTNNNRMVQSEISQNFTSAHSPVSNVPSAIRSDESPTKINLEIRKSSGATTPTLNGGSLSQAPQQQILSRSSPNEKKILPPTNEAKVEPSSTPNISFNNKCLNLIQEAPSSVYNILEVQSSQQLQAMSNLFPNDKQLSTENNNYTVIGVIGKQGSGKSRLLNELIGNKEQVFPEEDLECFLDCKYKTSGVDIYRTSDQQIFIDTQPLFASQHSIPYSGSSGIGSMGKSFETSVEAVSIAALESFIDITSLQVALFVFSVSHVVLVMIDQETDALEQFKMFQFIQTIRMLQQGVPTISQCGKSTQQKTSLEGHTPEIIFVYNKVNPADLNELNVKHTQSLLESYFASTSFRKNGIIHPNMWHHQFKKSDGENVNFFMVPTETKVRLNSLIF